MKISKANFTLRPWRPEDYVSLAEQANNKAIWNNVRDSFPHPYTEKDAQEFIETTVRKPSLLDFAIEIEGKAVGGVGFVPGEDVERLSAEVGYWLGEKYWNKRIASDAVETAVRYIFQHTELIRIFATIYEYNHASMKVLEHAGFTRLCILHKAAIKNGQIIDLHYYELLKL